MSEDFATKEKLTDEEAGVEIHSSASSTLPPSREKGEVSPQLQRPPGPPQHSSPDKNPFEVGWDGPDDPENPQAWPVGRRWYYTMLAGLLVFNATFASSAPSGIVGQMAEYMHFGEEVGSLTIALFVGGYCIGPILWGPLSEVIGRRRVFIISFAIYVCFQIGCALSKNTASILVFRFLGGCAAASPVSNSGAVISDIWDPKRRGKALAIFTLAPFAGPAVGPIVGGYITVGGASWRWLFWVLTMFAGSCLALIVFTLPETYPPYLLKLKAERIRKETGDDRYFAPMEARDRTFTQTAKTVLSKPFLMLAYEPMLLAITIYMSFVYGCLYLLFEAYPIVFGRGYDGFEGHHFNEGIQGLMFLPVLIGGAAGAMVCVFYFNPQYIKLFEKTAPKRPAPEVRLNQCAVGGPCFAVGFFWLGWTCYRSVSFWAPMLSGLLVGFGLVFVFQGLFNFVIDTYLMEAATALSAVTIVRSMAGAGFPLFASQMYKKLNPHWASTLVGCLTLLLVPIPLVFMRYGPALRARSKMSAKI